MTRRARRRARPACHPHWIELNSVDASLAWWLAIWPTSDRQEIRGVSLLPLFSPTHSGDASEFQKRAPNAPSSSKFKKKLQSWLVQHRCLGAGAARQRRLGAWQEHDLGERLGKIGTDGCSRGVAEVSRRVGSARGPGSADVPITSPRFRVWKAAQKNR